MLRLVTALIFIAFVTPASAKRYAGAEWSCYKSKCYAPSQSRQRSNHGRDVAVANAHNRTRILRPSQAVMAARAKSHPKRYRHFDAPIHERAHAANVIAPPPVRTLVLTQAEVSAMAQCEPPAHDAVVAEARDYLVKTAYPGGTMSRQGTRWTIEQFHPLFAVRMANAIWLARKQGVRAGIGSGYRQPGLGVGGFANKKDSWHSYGLASDMGGIGRIGDAAYALWNRIAGMAGLVNPYYGTYKSWEWNHYQLVASTIVPPTSPMRALVALWGPLDRLRMWLASGIAPDRLDTPKVAVVPEKSTIPLARYVLRHHRNRSRWG